MNIAVLCGGLSTERDVSISTGTNVAKALRERGHCVALVDLFLGVEPFDKAPAEYFTAQNDTDVFRVGLDSPDLEAVRRRREGDTLLGPGVLELCRAADICFLALHGADGENGKLQALLDLNGIPYTGSGYLGSAIAMDKDVSKILLRDAGVPVPPGVCLRRGESVPASIGFPCVVKPCSGGSSIGTSIVRAPEALSAALADAFSCDEYVLVEKYIRGRELTVGIMDGKAMAVIEIIPKTGFYDYKNKYQAGFTEELCPAPLAPEDTARVQRLAERVYQALHLEAYGRADFLMDRETGEIYCLEANTLPGMTPTSLIPQMAAAEGMSYAQLCERIIAVSQKKYRK
ncbi:MAG: D-alanine--D-alanine ligase [Oscillospiraceae bacterium]|nr:D-alanine--D-alanine ligase [Oscillospiraceae bacterium]